MARGKKKEAALSTGERLEAALVPVGEQPYQVPENWRWVKLQTLCAMPITDGTHQTPTYANKEDGVPFVSAKDVTSGYIDWTKIKYITKDLHEELYQRIAPQVDDVLLAKNGTTGVAAIVKDSRVFDIYVTLAVLRPMKEIVVPSYLYHVINSPVSKDQFDQHLTGIGVPNLHLRDIKETFIPLPPLKEQQRIVDRIESLFAKLDEAKEKAQEALDSFEIRKAAILYKAFSGQLSNSWRIERNITQDSWKSILWNDFIDSIEAGKNWNAEGRPPKGQEFGVVKVSAVTWGEFNELESKTCLEDSQWNPAVQIHPGDFLFSRANTLQLVGNCVIVDSISKQLMLSDKILRFTFFDCVMPKYILYFTRSGFYREQVEKLASGNQDGMRNISQKNLRCIQFPIPEKAEQAEIVRLLDAFFAREAEAKAQVEATLEAIDLMKKSILAKAFRGQLGTNDPAEESAEALLREILG